MRWQLFAGSVLLTVALAGCQTTGQDTLNYAANTNRIVSNLDKNLTPTVNKLNETVTDLNSRLDASEQEVRKQGGTQEAIQAQLQTMQQQLDEMQRRLYAERGLSAPRPSTAGPPTGPVVQPGPIVPESPAAGAPTVAPGPASGIAEAAPPLEEIRVSGTPPPGPLAAEPKAATTAVTAPAEAATTGSPGEDLYQQATKEYLKGNYNDALKLYDECLRQNPSDDLSARAHFWKGDSLLKLKKSRDAMREFEEVRSEAPTHEKVPFALYKEAEAHLQLGETQEAMDLLQKLIKEWPMSRPAQTAKKELEKSRAPQ